MGVTLLGLAILGLGTTEASAAEISVDQGGQINFVGAPGETNVLVMPGSGEEIRSLPFGQSNLGLCCQYRFEELGGLPLNAGQGCAQYTPSVVSCDRYGTQPMMSLVVDLGDGDDWVVTPGTHSNLNTLPPFTSVYIEGDDGNDNIQGTQGPDYIRTGPGDDHIDPRQGGDTVQAGPGDDRYASTAVHSTRRTMLRERVSLGDGDDHMRDAGTREKDRSLIVVRSGPGNDRLRLNAFGRYEVAAGPGRDVIDAADTPAPSNPTRARRSADRINCGSSPRDQARIDGRNHTSRCEKVVRIRARDTDASRDVLR